MTRPGPGEEPYAGPPPTGPYGAPPFVPGTPPRYPPPWPAAPPAAAGWYPPPFLPYGPPPYGPLPYAQISYPPVPAPRVPPHDVPRSYLQIMRTHDWAWWRPLLGLLLFGVVYAVAAVLAVVLVLVLVAASGRDILGSLSEQDLSDPWVLLATDVSLMVAIPVVWLVWVAAHGLRIGWSSSVLGRLRWRLLAPFAWRAALTIGAGIGLSVLLALAFGEQPAGGPIPDFGLLLAVVLLTTPLQSAAEEYVFRGYLSQAIAGWIRSERVGAVVAAVVSAALFSLAHLPPDAATFVDRFAVGLAASAVVRLTGGLEAAIALHTVNNVLVFLLAGLLGGGGLSGDASSGWLDVVITVAALAGYVALVAASRQRLRPETRTAAAGLPAPGAAYPLTGHPGPGVPPPAPAASGIVAARRHEVPYGPWGMG